MEYLWIEITGSENPASRYANMISEVVVVYENKRVVPDHYIFKKGDDTIMIDKKDCIVVGKVVGDLTKEMLFQLSLRDLISATQKHKAPKRSKFTDIQTQIIVLMFEEYSSPQIANNLERSVRTIENHRAVIFKKMKVNNKVGLVKYALRNKIVEL